MKVLRLPAGPDLDSLKLEADLSFPGRIRQVLTDLRGGFPLATINDRDVNVVQGMTVSRTRVKLFFDTGSGLLVRNGSFRRRLAPFPFKWITAIIVT